jgi:hypothetical protein
MRTENTGAANARPPIETSFKSGERDGTASARARSQEGRDTSGRTAVPNTAVFNEVSSTLARSLAQAAPTNESKGALSSAGLSDAPSNTSREGSGENAHADSGVPAVHVPAELRTAITALVAGDETRHAQSFSEVTTSDVPDLEQGSVASNSGEVRTAGRHDAHGTADAVISLSARAASALAAGTAMVPFGAIALGGASNMADFLAPAVVDGIKEPLSRSVAAAGFSGIFLGLTASVTTALGNDIAQMITKDRITPVVPEGQVSRGSQLLSAVKNQTIPAIVGFAAAFATANTLDANTGKLGDTNVNLETVFLKMARATAGAVGLGLAAEVAKQAFSDHTLTTSEANRVFDNTRSLGEAIKRNVTSLPQALSAYTRPTEKGKATEFGNVLGAAIGFATFAAIYGVVSGALKGTFGEGTDERLSQPDAQAAIATAAGVAGFVIADQLTRNIYANVMPVREAPVANDAHAEVRA